MTRTAFLAAYREHVKAGYPWASDPGRLQGFMTAVEVTLTTKSIRWAWDSDGTVAVWRSLGGKGKPTLKVLRALPA